MNDIIKQIQKILKIKTPLLKIYLSAILNKYFSDGFFSNVKSSSVYNLYKVEYTVLFFSSLISYDNLCKKSFND